jgi:alginate O-acetyltransferase complex protein AlgJ
MKRLSMLSIANFILSALFLAGIYVPVLKTLVSPRLDWSFSEKRKLAPMPRMSLNPQDLETFPAQFQNYYNDHFGFRERLIRAHSRLMQNYFDKSPVQKVMFGESNWLFFTVEKNIEDFLGLDPFTEDELQKWKSNLESKRNWLARQGVRYLFVIGPNKQTVYPEFLPDYLAHNRGRSRLDQFLAYMAEHSDIDILDLRDALLQAKKQHQVYYRTDTHWNSRGGYAAYRAIMERLAQLFPDKRLPAATDYLVKIENHRGGDLAVMLGMAETMPEERPVFELQHPCAVKTKLKLAAWNPDAPRPPFMTECRRAELRAVVFRDSFFEAVEPFFAEDFYRAAYLWTGYDQSLMNEVMPLIKPQVVIEEYGERRLAWIRKGDMIPADPVAAAPATQRYQLD